jgi:putative thioredoxin
MNDFIIDVSEKDFQKEVLDESRERLVVVDFWAAWGGPCRTLGPILEQLAEEGKGKWRLAKVDVDANPALAQALQVRGIPSVKAVKDGAIVDEFTGALPESQVRAWLEPLLPGPELEWLSEAKREEAAGKLDEAVALYERVLSEKTRQGDALFGLARIEAARGDEARATRHLAMILPDDAPRLAEEIASLRLRLAGGGIEEAQRQVRDDPEDLEAQVRLGRALAAADRHEEALETLLGVVRASPRVGPGEEARQAMLDVFGAIGARSPLADRYRSLMASELYR